MAMEIERKFLVARRPDLEASRVEIEQGYLALGDGQGDAEVRLRRKNDELYLTVKAGSGRTRVEEELELDREPFESLWPPTRVGGWRRRDMSSRVGKVDIELDSTAATSTAWRSPRSSSPTRRPPTVRAARLARRGGDGRRAVLEPDAGDERASTMTAFRHHRVRPS